MLIRALHRWLGILALALIMLLALSGAGLSIFPAAERMATPPIESGLSVAELAARIQTAYPGVEQIRRAVSGRITAYWSDGAAVIDPATGRAVASAAPDRIERWLVELHRSLFLGDGGRLIMAAGAAAMLMLSLSGMALVARRVGGWRRWFVPLHGPLSGRVHVEIARLAVFGLVFSSATALWMSAANFALLPDGGAIPAFPDKTSGETGAVIADMTMLLNIPAEELRELSFPYPGDATDVFTLKTDRGSGYLDQGTGELLGWEELTGQERVSETIHMLHTGQGFAIFGLVLGLIALGVPVLGGTGIFIWLAGRRGRARIRANRPAGRAETILLIGSENGSSWDFAATLHSALSAAGQSVHMAPMSAFAPERYIRAERIILLAATYGAGEAPASAKSFLARLAALDRAPDISLAVLGFGDRNSPAYCAFAKEVAAAAQARNWQELMPLDTVDRQSPQDFARWGRALGQVLGIELELSHQPVLPATEPLTLIARRDYGAEIQAPTAILRFALPHATLWQRLQGTGFARFEAGDLIGVLADGSPVPRLYSLASAHRDGFIEIVVKKHSGGLCSGQLMALEPGDKITAFLRRNPAFHPRPGQKPLILIGAGTGIGPLAGFVRSNARQRPIHLFFGMRHPGSDFLYGEEMPGWLEQAHLVRLVTAVSRGANRRYVQDALRSEAAQIVRLIRAGAQIMVCGGRNMATDVAAALAEILAPTGVTLAALKAEGRYVEDVY